MTEEWFGPRMEVVLLVSLGALFVLAEGIATVVLGSVYAGVFPGLFGIAIGSGLASVLLAGIALWLDYQYFVSPEGRGAWGTAIIVVSCFTIWFGGGFEVGFVLTLVGGVLALALPLPRAPDPREFEFGRPAAQVLMSSVPEEGGRRPAALAGRGAFAASAVVRYCPRCWSETPVESRACPRCGAELPSAPRSGG
jgi:hypothetical protein